MVKVLWSSVPTSLRKPSNNPEAGYGLFAEKDMAPGDALYRDISQFGYRIRFEMKAPVSRRRFTPLRTISAPQVAHHFLLFIEWLVRPNPV